MMKRLTIVFFLAMCFAFTTTKPPSGVLGMAEDEMWYPARIISQGGTQVTLEFSTGERITTDTSHVSELDWDIGERLECNMGGNGTYFWGMISKMMPDSTFWIVYDEGNLERTTYEFCRCQR